MFKQLAGLEHHTTAEAGGTSGLVQLQGQLQPVLRAVSSWVQMSPRMDATISLGNLFHCLIALTVKKPAAPYAETEFPVFQSVPVASCPVTRHH